MFNILKYIAVGVFIRRNKTNIIILLFLGLFLIVFLMIMSDIKSHVSDDGVVEFLITKWFISVSIILFMLWRFIRIFQFRQNVGVQTDITELKKKEIPPKKVVASTPQLQTRGEAIKEKYSKRTNGKD
jgi:hypothetical protein